MQLEKISSTVFTPLTDGTGVLLNLDTLFYYSLNRTGAALWQQIEEKKVLTVEDLISVTCEMFDVHQTEARRTLVSFIERLAELKMILVSER